MILRNIIPRGSERPLGNIESYPSLDGVLIPPPGWQRTYLGRLIIWIPIRKAFPNVAKLDLAVDQIRDLENHKLGRRGDKGCEGRIRNVAVYLSVAV